MQKRPLTTGLRILLTAFVFSGASAGYAEQMPLPKVDYEAKAKLLNEGTLFIRHSNGKMRIELQMPQFKEPATGFIDIGRKRMVLILPIPGIQDSAIEVEFGDDATFGQVLGEAQQTSQQRVVAGESCAVWKIVASEENKAAACLTSDYIVLRTQATIEGKTRTVFEVTELKRQPQNAADLEVPSNVNIMKMPKGLKGIPGFPRL